MSELGAAPPSVLPYAVRRSRRARRARLTVSDAGEAVVVLPERAPLREAARLVERHGDWLERHLERARTERARLAEGPALGEGRVLMVAGRPHRTATVDAAADRPARGRVEGVGDLLILRLGRDGIEAPALLEAWLRERARAALGERVATRAREMGLEPGRMSVRDQRTRWASASRSGALSFSWRLVLAPPEVLDAVVVHELAHLRIRGHSKAFWALVVRHAPGTPSARLWLRHHARALRSALD